MSSRKAKMEDLSRIAEIYGFNLTEEGPAEYLVWLVHSLGRFENDMA